MPAKTITLGGTSGTPFVISAGTDETSQIKATWFEVGGFTHPVSGAVGSTVKPILFKSLAITGVYWNDAYNNYDNTNIVTAQIATSSNGSGGVQASAGGHTWSGSMAAFAGTTYYYGFEVYKDGESGASYFAATYFKRGAYSSSYPSAVDGIYENGTLDTSSWAGTSIGASVTYWHVPTAPTVSTATVGVSNRVTLSWSAPSDNGGSAVTGYRVMYKRNQDADTAANWTVLTSGSANSSGVVSGTSAVVTGLSAATTYNFRVAALNAVSAAHNSSYASSTAHTGANGSINATIPAAPVFNSPNLPSAIVGFPYAGSVTASNTSSYSISPSNALDGSGISFNTSTGEFTSFAILAPGVYTFTVTATGQGGTATSSSLAIVTSYSGPQVVTATSPTTTVSRSLIMVKQDDGTWKLGIMKVYDDRSLAPDGTYWHPLT